MAQTVSENRERPMTPEFWAIIGVGVMILTLGWFGFNSLRGDINNIDQRLGQVEQRLAALEATVGLIVQGLRIEIKGAGE